MMTPEARLRIFLRIMGTAAMLAVVAVFMPREWMDLCHRHLGMGPLPDGPIVEYLARSTSMFYAMFGGVLWYLARDVRRFRRAIKVVAIGIMVVAGTILMVDLRAGMPPWWATMEPLANFSIGLIMFVLHLRVRRAENVGG